MTHKFLVGQSVVLAPTILRQAVTGEYEIRRLVPASDRDPGNPLYCIKSIGENHERMAFESELSLSARNVSCLAG